MWPRIIGFYRTGAARPLIEDPVLRRHLYERLRFRVFLSITLGYGFFYTTRLSLSVAKKPMLDSGVLSAGQMGQIGSALLFTYAVGKTVNGFLGDRVHLQRFFVSGLLLSAVANLVFGLSFAYPVFLLLWALNGWFQSVGSTTSGISLASWFPPGQLGTRYAIWSVSHNLGEGLTFAITALLVSGMGWRWGFLGPGLVCVLVALVLCRTMADRPGALGLPGPAREVDDPADVALLQAQVLRSPMVWVLGLASAFLYVARYALNNWGILYLQADRSYSLVQAGFVVSLLPILGIAGTVSSGVISDRLFSARRGPVTIAYGVLLIAALCGVLLMPVGHTLLLSLCMGAAGFAIGGQMVFLGGLAALDICDKRASGAVLGVVGGLSYLGAAAQDYLSGHMIQTRSAHVYDFHRVKYVWICAAVLSLLLALTLLRAEDSHGR